MKWSKQLEPWTKVIFQHAYAKRYPDQLELAIPSSKLAKMNEPNLQSVLSVLFPREWQDLISCVPIDDLRSKFTWRAHDRERGNVYENLEVTVVLHELGEINSHKLIIQFDDIVAFKKLINFFDSQNPDNKFDIQSDDAQQNWRIKRNEDLGKRPTQHNHHHSNTASNVEREYDLLDDIIKEARQQQHANNPFLLANSRNGRKHHRHHQEQAHVEGRLSR